MGKANNSELKRLEILQKARNRSEISRNGLTEEKHRTYQTVQKADKEELTALCRRMKEHRRRFREYMRMVEGLRKRQNTRKILIKSLNSSNLDTVENNTDNVQIKSDNFKNWFGDWKGS